MATPSIRIPSYCEHKARGLAYVRLSGEMVYLGKYDSLESRQMYDRVLAEWMQAGRTYVKPADTSSLSVNEVLLAYRRYADAYYVNPDGSPAPEIIRINLAFRPLTNLYGTTPAAQFGPRALAAVQEKMVVDGLCIRTINQRIGCIKRAFRWAVKQELVPPAVYHGLTAVEGLRQGRCKAKESKSVKPVPHEVVDVVMKYLPPTLQAMVKLHELTGMRSGEMVIMRGVDIEIRGEGKPWLYKPQKHKTQRHGHQRVVSIGPKAQEVLQPFLKPDVQAYIFSPAQACTERNIAKRIKRKSNVQPSQLDRSKPNPKRAPGEKYTTGSYGRAVNYATRLAVEAGELPEGTHWHPHQLRHNAATRIRKQFGLEAVRATLGHRSVVQSAQYAELDTDLAVSTAAAVG